MDHLCLSVSCSMERSKWGSVACKSQHRLKSCMRMKTFMKMVTV